jgi:hypothetical protein
MSAKELRIRIKGKEKASFYYEETETYEENGESRTRTHTRKEKMSKKLLEFDGVCWTFDPALGPLPPGDYTVPFEFDLPNNLPASIMF